MSSGCVLDGICRRLSCAYCSVARLHTAHKMYKHGLEYILRQKNNSGPCIFLPMLLSYSINDTSCGNTYALMILCYLCMQQIFNCLFDAVSMIIKLRPMIMMCVIDVTCFLSFNLIMICSFPLRIEEHTICSFHINRIRIDCFGIKAFSSLQFHVV